MFTGIVETTGRVVESDRGDAGTRLKVTAPFEDIRLGDSVAVNGVCLTAVAVDRSGLTFDVVPETLGRTNLGLLAAGDEVNLERPMPVGGRFDGHMVQGHVDGLGRVAALDAEGEGRRMTVEVPDELRRYLAEKGSVAVDGVSLTVATLTESGFQVALIPHTLEVTVLGRRAVGDMVNIEIDVLAKYVERLLGEGG